MSNPDMNGNDLSQEEKVELEKLRASYRQAGGGANAQEPSELLDASIRKLARDEIRREAGAKRGTTPGLAGWAGVIGLAASVGFAVVLVPRLLVSEEPAALLHSESNMADGNLEIRLRQEKSAAADITKEEATAQRARQSSVNQARMATSAPPAQSPHPEQDQSLNQHLGLAEAALAPAPADLEEEVMQSLNAAAANGELDMDSLRAELAQAPEPEWRATLVALRDSNRRPQAEELLPDYRSRFDLPDTLTLDQLVVASQE